MIRSTARFLRLFPLLACVASAPLQASSESPLPTTVPGWEEIASREFPELLKPSEFSRLFREQVDLFRAHWPETFQDPSWPYRIALWVSQWMEHKKEAQEVQKEALKAQREARRLIPSAQSEKSRPINEICKQVLREKLKSGEIHGPENEWIQGDHIDRSKKIDALHLSTHTSPELIPALKDFVAAGLQKRSPNLPEDCDWLKAILQTPTLRISTAVRNPPLHKNLASLLAMEETDFIFALLTEIGDANFAEDLLYGRVLSLVSTATFSRELRTALIEKLVRENLKLGPWTFSKARFLEFLFNGSHHHELSLMGRNFELIEHFEVHDWPDSFFQASRAPGHHFHPSEKDWHEYQQVLEAFWLNLSGDQWPWSGLLIPGKTAAPGRLEHYILWHCQRLGDPKAAAEWLKEVRQRMLKSATPNLRARIEIIPALEHLLDEKFNSSPR